MSQNLKHNERTVEPMETPPIDPREMSPSVSRILDAARALFFAHGFSAVTTDQLCKEAQTSKRTLYKYFGDMAGVLAAVVSRESDRFEKGVVLFAQTPAEYWQSVINYGTNLVTLLNDIGCVRLDQILHEEARHYPLITQLFYNAAYGQAHAVLTEQIRHGQSVKFITKPQTSSDIADNLISMWEGLAYVRRRLGLQDYTCADPYKWSTQCVEMLFEADFRRELLVLG
jgi:TetR/AcrR family transcriptional regulator, mexJK operon transcriptional repressor